MDLISFGENEKIILAKRKDHRRGLPGYFGEASFTNKVTDKWTNGTANRLLLDQLVGEDPQHHLDGLFAALPENGQGNRRASLGIVETGKNEKRFKANLLYRIKISISRKDDRRMKRMKKQILAAILPERSYNKYRGSVADGWEWSLR